MDFSTDFVTDEAALLNELLTKVTNIENMLLELKQTIANVGPALAQSPLGAMFAGILGGE